MGIKEAKFEHFEIVGIVENKRFMGVGKLAGKAKLDGLAALEGHQERVCFWKPELVDLREQAQMTAQKQSRGQIRQKWGSKR